MGRGNEGWYLRISLGSRARGWQLVGSRGTGWGFQVRRGIIDAVDRVNRES